MTKPYLTALLLGLPLLAAAQAAPGRHATVLDLTGAVGPSLNYASVAGWRLWGLDAAGRFQAGLGVRGSYYFADELTLDRQSGEAGPASLLVVPDPRLGAVNLAFHVRARVAGPLRVGFNLDLAGISFGAERLSSYPGFLLTNVAFTARPTRATCCWAAPGTAARSTRSCMPAWRCRRA